MTSCGIFCFYLLQLIRVKDPVFPVLSGTDTQAEVSVQEFDKNVVDTFFDPIRANLADDTELPSEHVPRDLGFVIVIPVLENTDDVALLEFSHERFLHDRYW
jgi:hypothetical protein